ncbi:MAG: hypothetical protein LKF74_07250 [Megasphaera sp.]|jgi:hypothetical protein|nr:hypothetical protein [Megasphaera sp.]MCH4218338.1 hypothetical protein [Megasphaera sp.]
MKLKLRVKQACCTIAAVVMVGSAALAASPTEVYREAVENMTANPQAEYTVNMAFKMPMIGTANVNNVVDIQNEPFKSKTVTTIEIFGNNNNDPIRTYMEQNGNKLDVYYEQTENKKTSWKKTSQKLDSNEPIAKSFRQSKNPLAGVKTVTKAGTNQYTVVYDSQKLYSEKDKQAWQKGEYTKEQINTMESVLQALQKAGDVTVNVTIDPATKRISRISVPLTEQMRGVALAVVDQVKTTDANKAMVQQFIKFSDVDMTIDCKALPSGIDLTVPAEVKKQAKEDTTTTKK